jgi:hypothetical protein
MIKTTVQGIPGAKRAMKKWSREKPLKVKRGMNKAADYLMERSLEVCPLDTGFLRSSIYKKNAGTFLAPDVQVGYSAPYAIYVHEDPEPLHPIGDYKFLEQPVKEYKQTLIYLVYKEVEEK